MKASNIELLKSSGTATVDTVAAGIDVSLGGAPLASGAWGLSKALLGRGLALRQKKALEWVEMIRDNPTIFTKEILETEEFQDAFVTSLESYIKERDYDKRILLQAIFKDYSSAKNPSTYPVERYYEITKQISLHDAKNFSYLRMIASEGKPGDSVESGDMESTLHLISLGLLIQDSRPRFLSADQKLESPSVYISSLGTRYAKFIEEIDTKLPVAE